MANTLDTYTDDQIMTALISRSSIASAGYFFEDDVVTKIADFMFAGWGTGHISKFYFPNLLTVCDGAFATCVGSSYTCEFDFSKIEYIGHFAFRNIGESTSYKDCLYRCSSNLTINAKTIGYGAFKWVNSLVNVSLPNWDTMPSHYAETPRTATSTTIYSTDNYECGVFGNCKNLASVSAPKMVYNDKLIGAFNGCSALTSVSFPSLTKIAPYMFYYAGGLTQVTDAMFPEVTEIGDEYAFESCTSLASVTMSKVTTIGGFAFRNCTALTTVSFPEATYIKRSAFLYCNSLASVNLPKVTEMEMNAFGYNQGITSINFPELTTVHGSSSTGTFGNMRALVSATLPKLSTVSESTARIFASCSVLKTVDIGGDLNRLSSGMFYGCTVFDTLILRGVTGVVPCPNYSMTSTASAFYNTPFASGGGTLYVPDALVASYGADTSTGWTNFRNAGNQIKGLSQLPT